MIVRKGIASAVETAVSEIIKNSKVGDTIVIVYSRDKVEYTTNLTLQEYVPDYYKNNDLK